MPELPHFQLWKNRRDVYKLLLAGLYFAFCSYCACLSNSYADRTNPNNNLPFEQKYSAPDVLMDAMAPISKRNTWVRKDISDVLVAITGQLTVLFCLTRGNNCCTLLKRFLVITGSLFLLRAPMTSMTVLPTPYHYCESKYDENIWIDGLALLFQRRVSCGDVFYSGHTIGFATCLMLFIYNSPHIIVTIFMFFLSISGMISLLYTAYHYTIDILIAFILTFNLWVMYHWAAEIEELKRTPWGRVVGFWEETGPPGTGRWRLGDPLEKPSGDAPRRKWWGFAWMSKNRVAVLPMTNDTVLEVSDLDGGRNPLLDHATREQ